MEGFIHSGLFKIVLLVVVLLVTYSVLSYVLRKPKEDKFMPIVFCRKCGWSGKVGKYDKTCRMCGSTNLEQKTR